MAVTLHHDPVLARFRTALGSLYGDRLARLVLFGSRARGDAGPDSDYDVAVLLKEPIDFWAEMERLADIGTDILYDSGAVISAVPFRDLAWLERTPLMGEIRREGLDV
jgi:predicted nucleotidyltransferase